MSYEIAVQDIVAEVGVDLAAVREKVLREMETRGLNPTQLAKRAGVNQSNLARWLRLDRTITELRARVLFQVIEDGLGMNLVAFFTQLEADRTGMRHAEAPEHPEPKEGAPHESAPVSPPPLAVVPLADLERFARRIGRSISREIRATPHSKQPASARPARAKRRKVGE